MRRLLILLLGLVMAAPGAAGAGACVRSDACLTAEQTGSPSANYAATMLVTAPYGTRVEGNLSGSSGGPPTLATLLCTEWAGGVVWITGCSDPMTWPSQLNTSPAWWTAYIRAIVGPVPCQGVPPQCYI